MRRENLNVLEIRKSSRTNHSNDLGHQLLFYTKHQYQPGVEFRLDNWQMSHIHYFEHRRRMLISRRCPSWLVVEKVS